MKDIINDIEKQVRKPKIHYSTEIGQKICDAVEQGATIYSLSLQDDYPARGTMYTWIEDYSEFASMYKKSCNKRKLVIKDAIFNQSQLSNIDTVLQDASGKLSTHSAGVAAVDKSNHWLAWFASRDNLVDDSVVDIEFKGDTAQEQTKEILEMTACGKLTLKQADTLMTLVQKQIEMTELKDLKNLVAAQSELIAKILNNDKS